jgi:hypothetical protein
LTRKGRDQLDGVLAAFPAGKIEFVEARCVAECAELRRKRLQRSPILRCARQSPAEIVAQAGEKGVSLLRSVFGLFRPNW